MKTFSQVVLSRTEACASPKVISTSPQNILTNRNDWLQFFCDLNSSKKTHLSVGQVKNIIHNSNSKIHQPRAYRTPLSMHVEVADLCILGLPLSRLQEHLEHPLLDHSPALTQVVKYCSNTRWTAEQLLFESYAAMIMKYVEANSLAIVLARVDLCTCIKAIPSMIWAIKLCAAAGRLAGQQWLPFSRTDGSLFIGFLRLPSLWTSEQGDGDTCNLYERTSLRLVCLALAKISRRLNRSM